MYRHQAIPYSNIAYLIDIKCKFRYNSLCEFYDTKVGIGDVVCSFISENGDLILFDEVKGQDHIVTTLRNQIKNDRLGHAFLFCGTRGTGKNFDRQDICQGM